MPAPIWGAGRAPPPQGGAVLQQYHQGDDGLMKSKKIKINKNQSLITSNQGDDELMKGNMAL